MKKLRKIVSGFVILGCIAVYASDMDKSDIEVFNIIKATQAEIEKPSILDKIKDDCYVIEVEYKKGAVIKDHVQNVNANMAKYVMLASIEKLKAENEELKAKDASVYSDAIKRNEVLIAKYEKETK